MSSPNVVVDGSNIATEGRSAPSLAQLDEAVREYLRERADAVVTVVVDATFGHRIDESERQMFEEARSAGEIVSPPAGAIGRGDAFLLRIAEKTGAVVLSNDSFQEFHGEHDWLFSSGRLIGGVPVAGVGWIFTPRTPVRGPRSREAVKAAKRTRKAPAGPPPERKPVRGKPKVGDSKLQTGEVVRSSGRRGRSGVATAIAAATQEVVEPAEDENRRRRRRRAGGPPSEPVNEPLAFINFVAAHRPGTEVDGEIESFSSHGAFVMVGDVRCYIPLSAMGTPPPRSAREVLSKGATHTFVVQALDPPRRGVELALPGFAHVSGVPTEETVEAEITEAPPHADAGPRRRASKKTAARKTAPPKKLAGVPPARRTAAKKTSAPKKAAAKKTPAPKKAAARTAASNRAASKKSAKKTAPPKKAATKKTSAPKKSPAPKIATAPRRAPQKKAAAAKAPARKTVTKKTATKKTAVKKTAAKKATPKATSSKKAAAKKR